MLRDRLADPAQLAVLTDVLETVIAYRKLEGREAHQDCADELMAFYHSGVEDRGELLSCMGVNN